MDNKEFETITPETLQQEYDAAQDAAAELQEDVEKAVGTFEAKAEEVAEAVPEAVEAVQETVTPAFEAAAETVASPFEAAAETVDKAIPDGPVNLTEQWQKEHYGEAGRKMKADEAAAAAAAAAAGAAPAFEQPQYEQKFEQPQYQQDFSQQYQQPNYQQPQFDQQNYAGYDPYGMQPFGNDKAMGIIAYITLIGFLIALFGGANNGRRSPYLNFHLNQSLILLLANVIVGIISGISVAIGGLLSLVVFVFWIMAIVGAAKGQTKPLPLIENIKLIK